MNEEIKEKWEKAKKVNVTWGENSHDNIYKGLLKEILFSGEFRPDRTGTGTISVFGAQTRYDLMNGFPLLTSKRVHWRSVFHELIWFLRGETNIAYLKENGVSIWDEWVDENGDLGPVYGKQWTAWGDGNGGSLDQITEVAEAIRKNPFSRRHMVCAWNPPEVETMALPPCHCLFQFYVSVNGTLNCQLYQRSADVFLGVPFNIASYALLLEIMAKATGLEAGEFIHTFGDLHIYTNHLDQVIQQLQNPSFIPPKIKFNKEIINPREICYDDITLLNYQHAGSIKAPVAV